MYLEIGEGFPRTLECNSSGKFHEITSISGEQGENWLLYTTKCGLSVFSTEMNIRGYGWILHNESSNYPLSTCKNCNKL